MVHSEGKKKIFFQTKTFALRGADSSLSNKMALFEKRKDAPFNF